MQEQEKTFTTSDGVEVFYRYLPASNESSKKGVILFHRGHEHSGRMMHIAHDLNLKDCAFFAWDARGHGKSPGARGDSPSVARSVADIQDFVEHIQTTYGLEVENLAVIAQSVGAVLVATWLHDYAPKIRCAVLASPAFKVKLYVPFARQGLKLLQRLRGNFFVNSYVKAKFLSHDPKRQASYDQDPLIARAISARILLGLYDASERVIADAAAITTPIQLLISGSDWVVHQGPQHDFYNHLGSHIKERHVLLGFYHDTLGELHRAKALAHVKNFLCARFAEDFSSVDMTHADRHGASRLESDVLATPLKTWSIQGMYWGMQRRLIHFGRHFSKGLALGVKTGFDSGSTLDYVYRNQAQGSSVIGRWIDQHYLNAIGWRGIRQRKVHFGIAIQKAISILRAQHRPVHVLDVASGHGRYVLDALSSADLPDSIQLRDYSDINVKAGQQLIAERNLQDIASFVQADAFDPNNYHTAKVRPTLGIVSGLYELFPDNAVINQSLQGFADTLEEGSLLVYSNQPWHPQLEMIARCLSSHRNGQNWVMRRRSQQEMDQLVEQAGFRKIHEWIDEDGIFTVSLAARRGQAADPA